MPQILLLLFFGLQLLCPPSWSAPLCAEIYTPVEVVWSSQLRFSQNFLGREWGNHKLAKLIKSYTKKKENLVLTESEYVLHLSNNDPLPTIRDTNGRLRLIDNHHRFYSYVEFIGLERTRFRVYVKVLKDYSQGLQNDGRPWDETDMIADLVKNSYILIYNNMAPTMADLNDLPSSIIDMPDMRARSIMGFVLNAMPVPLKGSDFKKMIQFKLYHQLIDLGIEVEGKKPFSTSNIHRLRDIILSSQDLMQFLQRRINPELEESRRKKVENLFVQFQ